MKRVFGVSSVIGGIAAVTAANTDITIDHIILAGAITDLTHNSDSLHPVGGVIGILTEGTEGKANIEICNIMILGLQINTKNMRGIALVVGATH